MIKKIDQCLPLAIANTPVFPKDSPGGAKCAGAPLIPAPLSGASVNMQLTGEGEFYLLGNGGHVTSSNSEPFIGVRYATLKHLDAILLDGKSWR